MFILKCDRCGKELESFVGFSFIPPVEGFDNDPVFKRRYMISKMGSVYNQIYLCPDCENDLDVFMNNHTEGGVNDPLG